MDHPSPRARHRAQPGTAAPVTGRRAAPLCAGELVERAWQAVNASMPGADAPDDLGTSASMSVGAERLLGVDLAAQVVQATGRARAQMGPGELGAMHHLHLLLVTTSTTALSLGRPGVADGVEAVRSALMEQIVAATAGGPSSPRRERARS